MPAPRPDLARVTGTGRWLAWLYAGLIAANALAWAAAFWLFRAEPGMMATALVAWVFGLRHAVDADHIAAIDNVVRKLMQDGRRAETVGLFFSLGHSTIVILAVLVVAGTASVFREEFDGFKAYGGIFGTAVSAFFLLAIGFANLVVLRAVWRAFGRARRGEQLSEAEHSLIGTGVLARMTRPVFRLVTRSWHMYPLGFLFGLGFDTATEIGLIGISAAQAAQGVSVWSMLVFPALFTAGMTLVDTTDSVVMSGAYGWAFVNPLRKLWYNLTITAASVAVALFIGGAEALNLLADKLGLEGAFWSAVGALNDNLANFGFVVVGIFVLTWLVSMLIYRFKDYDRLATP